MSNILRLENNYSWFESEDEEIKTLLWKSLRFRAKNYFHNFRFRAKLWDGYDDFFKKDSGRFLTGLLPEVKMALKVKNIEYEISDLRKPFQWAVPSIDKYFLSECPKPVKELRDYQVEYVNKTIRYGRGLITSPTGCHRIGQKILMYNGEVKKVENIIVGDLLMGMDGNARKVLNLCRGIGQMYEINPIKGKSFVVNDEHILTLQNDKKELIDVSVNEYLHEFKKYKLIRKQNSNLLTTEFFIEKLGIENFYGFTLDGDQRYLLDDFTITHNSGKSNAMKAIIKALPPKTPTLVLANKTSLVDQNYEEIKSMGIDGVGRLYGTKKEPNYITCSTSQSAHLLKPVMGKIQVLIVDEIHEMMSKIPKRIYASLKNCPIRIGMSATAFKYDGKDLCQKYETKGWFGPPFDISTEDSGKLTTKSLQDKGILSHSDCIFYRITEPKIPHAIYLDAVTLGIAENEYFHKITAKLVSGLSGRVLIIVDRIEHGDRLQKLIPQAMWIQGKDDLETRKIVINKLKYDDNFIGIATGGIFTSGLDVCPEILINCASGQAEHQIIQKMGRGLRRGKNKNDLIYYDFYFEINDYLEKHSKKRIGILEKEGHSVEIRDWSQDDI